MTDNKGWFSIPGLRKGDRTVQEQMLGVSDVLERANGKTVLDLGCAEGAITLEFAKAGAASILAVDLLESHLKIARSLCADHPQVTFIQGNLDHLIDEVVEEQYDIVLALAIIHKLRSVERGLDFAAKVTKELLLIRTPVGVEKTGRLRAKTGGSSGHIPTVMKRNGLTLDALVPGPRGEHVWRWRR